MSHLAYACRALPCCRNCRWSRGLGANWIYVAERTRDPCSFCWLTTLLLAMAGSRHRAVMIAKPVLRRALRSVYSPHKQRGIYLLYLTHDLCSCHYSAQPAPIRTVRSHRGNRLQPLQVMHIVFGLFIALCGVYARCGIRIFVLEHKAR